MADIQVNEYFRRFGHQLLEICSDAGHLRVITRRRFSSLICKAFYVWESITLRNVSKTCIITDYLFRPYL